MAPRHDGLTRTDDVRRFREAVSLEAVPMHCIGAVSSATDSRESSRGLGRSMAPAGNSHCRVLLGSREKNMYGKNVTPNFSRHKLNLDVADVACR